MEQATEPTSALLFAEAPSAKASRPLHVQIAGALRYGIGTGQVAAGERLPTAAMAAKGWGVNLHTVRRAYGSLADEGLITMQPRLGARVRRRGSALPGKPLPLGAFLDGVLDYAEQAYGLGPDDFAELLRRHRHGLKRKGAITVMECTADQAAHHGAELDDAFGLEANPFCIDERIAPPPGPILGTYFHLAEIAARWPERVPDVLVVSIEPSSEIGHHVTKAMAPRSEIVLHETNPVRANMIAAQLRNTPMLVHGCLSTSVGEMPSDPSAVVRGKAHIFTPRHWAALPQSIKKLPETFELPYQIAEAELHRIAPLLDRPN